MTQRTADQRIMHVIAAALAAEYRVAEEAARQGDVPLAWHYLGRSHILARTRLARIAYRAVRYPLSAVPVNRLAV